MAYGIAMDSVWNQTVNAQNATEAYMDRRSKWEQTIQYTEYYQQQ